MKLPIYLDYSATTPVDPRVAEKMMQFLTMDGTFGNPASRSHRFGWQAEEAVDIARNQIAELVGADPREIVFTSGATESDNLAIKGAANFYQKKGKHIITSKTEHKAVLDTCRQLEREGFEVTYLAPQRNGIIDLKELEAAMRDDTILVSIMHVNNEIGVVQDIAAIGEMCRARGIIYHVDATQSVGKLPIDLSQLKVDLMSFSGHKIYGPKGIGALYVRRKPRIRIEAQVHGGGHERGMRSGTLPVHQIVGMGEAYRIAKEEMTEEMARLRTLRDRLWNGVKDMEEVYLNGDLDRIVPLILAAVCAWGVAYLLVTLSVVMLRIRRPDLPRAYRSPWFPLPQIISSVGIIIAIVNITPPGMDSRQVLVPFGIMLGMTAAYALFWTVCVQRVNPFKPLVVEEVVERAINNYEKQTRGEMTPDVLRPLV